MDDLISRKALWKEMSDFCKSIVGDHTPDYNDAVSLIGSMPTLDAEIVKHAHCEVCTYVEPDGHGFVTHIQKGGLLCTNCRRAYKRQHMSEKNYCPRCGAKMDEGDGEREEE